MADRLEPYRRKRDARRTPEPAGTPAPAADDAAPALRFVVQQHSATRLHWDLRLEHDGTLASWAVPKGIPMDPADDHLAVRTEDHPLEYLAFHGEIPKGNYGAGTMTIWDRGTYVAEKWRDDEVIAVFDGERVQGRYALFRTRGSDWMVHRMDPPADPDFAPPPEALPPMLARPGTLPPDDDAWAYEPKWDGIRALVLVRPADVRIQTRSLRDVTHAYPELRRLDRALGTTQALLDGEIVALDERGRPSFERLQRRMHATDERRIDRLRRQLPVTFVAFDVLWLDGRPLLDLPWAERRERLEALALKGERWLTSPVVRAAGSALWAATREQGLEGVIAKRADAPYEPGKRTGAWIKAKHTQRGAFLVGGWLPGEGARAQRLGALLVGRRDDDGRLEYAGRVGTGFTDAELRRLERLLGEHARDTNPFARNRGPRGARWVEPCYVAEVEFHEVTSDGVLRHPSYKGIAHREEVPDTAPAAGGPDAAGLAADEPVRILRALGKGREEAEVDGRRLTLSNRTKVLYRATGTTKGDVVDYYARIAEVLLPHLRGRPLTMTRWPDGPDGEGFFEKQIPSHAPEWVARAKPWPDGPEFPVAEERATLVWTANLAALELHPQLALAEAIDRPTLVAFDLDPGAPADIVDCCRVGVRIRDVLAGLGLRCFPKTSGSKGLQLYVPLNDPEVTYARTKAFSRAVAELLERDAPGEVVSRMTKAIRGGKVFVDWSQNDETKTTVAVYSLRARERPTVSTPVRWEEVEDCLASGDAGRLAFTAGDVLRRVEAHGDLFADVVALRQDLPG